MFICLLFCIQKERWFRKLGKQIFFFFIIPSKRINWDSHLRNLSCGYTPKWNVTAVDSGADTGYPYAFISDFFLNSRALAHTSFRIVQGLPQTHNSVFPLNLQGAAGGGVWPERGTAPPLFAGTLTPLLYYINILYNVSANVFRTVARR